MARATIERVLELLTYNPETGELKWKVDRHGGPGNKLIPAGTIAGCFCKGNGYMHVNIDLMPHCSHRVAWAIAYGMWPTHQIDHINMDRTDNRLCNLREATNAQNSHNRKAQSNNKSTGVKGVSKITWSTKDGERTGFVARLGTKHIGLFNTLEEATSARNKEAVAIHKEFFRP